MINILGYFVETGEELTPANVMVFVETDDELLVYCPIGQHSTSDHGYLSEKCTPITKEQYVQASKGFYTPADYLQ